jgi:hypothetical protein
MADLTCAGLTFSAAGDSLARGGCADATAPSAAAQPRTISAIAARLTRISN